MAALVAQAVHLRWHGLMLRRGHILPQRPPQHQTQRQTQPHPTPPPPAGNALKPACLPYPAAIPAQVPLPWVPR